MAIIRFLQDPNAPEGAGVFIDEQGNQRYAHAPDLAAKLASPVSAAQMTGFASPLGTLFSAPMQDPAAPQSPAPMQPMAAPYRAPLGIPGNAFAPPPPIESPTDWARIARMARTGRWE